jgi:hypothetical protein
MKTRNVSLRTPPLGGDRAQDQAVPLADAAGQLAGVIGDLSALVQRMAPTVIGVQTVALDANGTAAVSYRVPYQAITVDSQSAKVLTVANMPLQGAAPASGPGVAFVRIGGFAVQNFRGYAVSVYGGNQGELVTIAAYGTPLPPDTIGGAGNPGAAVTASVASSAATVPLFAPAASANGRTVFNESTAVLYLKFGATASLTSYTVQIAAGGYFEFPAPVYTGEVDGIWSAANGFARLTSW